MKKVLLFLWFGDEKPPYVDWTLDNFRQINPGWEIRYIEYSNEQLKNYKDQNDPILEKSMENLDRKDGHMYTRLSDMFRMNYLESHSDELVIYCDLDCFPIAPFDNFIYSQDDKSFCAELGNVFCKQEFIGGNEEQSWIGTCTSWPPFRPLIKRDWWCICNSKLITVLQFLQFHKGSIFDDTLIVWEGVFMNKCNTDKYFQRKKDFFDMKIELGNNFSLPQFTPIEHYYSKERDKLNLNANM